MAQLFQGFPAMVDRGAVRFDLRPLKRTSNGVQMDAKSQGGRPTLRRSCPGFWWTVKLCCHTRGPQALLWHPQKPYTRFASVRFLRVR